MSAQQPRRKIGDLEISEDIEFQKKSWRFERVSQYLVLLLVVLALLGLFGGGPISSTTRTSQNGLQVECPRFQRNHSSYRLKITPSAASIREGQVSIWVDQSLLHALRIENITPESVFAPQFRLRS